MTQEEKFEEAKKLYQSANDDQRYILESLFPELKLDKDERIRKLLIRLFSSNNPNEKFDDISAQDILAWLEKQAKDKKDVRLESLEKLLDADTIYQMVMNDAMVEEAKNKAVKALQELAVSKLLGLEKQGKIDNVPLEGSTNTIITNSKKPKFHKGDWIVFNGLTLLVNEVVQGYYRTISIGGIHNSYDWDINNIARLWNIEDAKDGDTLVTYDIQGNLEWLFLYRPNKHKLHINDPRFYCHYDIKADLFKKDNDYVSVAFGTKIRPATKEQDDFLFSKMRESGYVWDYERKELRKIEPKFHEGEWIACKGFNTALIVNINDDKYEVGFIDGNKGFPHIDYVDRFFHLWTLEDAKDGDVLTCENGWTCIFKCLNDNLFSSHCFMDHEGWFCEDGGEAHTLDKRICGKIYPATKEQRGLLFAKMKEAGYEWDANKKELRKISQYKNKWKPSDEQIKAIRLARAFVTDDFNEHPTLSEILVELENQLKKLKEE